MSGSASGSATSTFPSNTGTANNFPFDARRDAGLEIDLDLGLDLGLELLRDDDLDEVFDADVDAEHEIDFDNCIVLACETTPSALAITLEALSLRDDDLDELFDTDIDAEREVDFEDCLVPACDALPSALAITLACCQALCSDAETFVGFSKHSWLSTSGKTLLPTCERGCKDCRISRLSCAADQEHVATFRGVVSGDAFGDTWIDDVVLRRSLLMQAL